MIKILKFLLVAIILIFVVFAAYFFLIIKVPQNQPLKTELYPGSNSNVKRSILFQDPRGIQHSLIGDIVQGKNTSLTRESAYFVTHRFFDTGNTIDEVYNFIHTHPEVDFLKKGERIYPKIFAKYEKHIPLTKNEQLLAYLSYIEELQNAGYADGAAYGTAAARYMELYDRTNQSTTTKQIYLRKAILFMDAALPIVNQLMRTGTTTIAQEKDDNLVTLNQYGVAKALFEKNNIQASSTYMSSQILKFALQYAHDNKLALYPYTALNYCYGLVTVGNVDEIKTVGLGQIMVDQSNNMLSYRENGLTDKIVNGEKKGFAPNSIYGKKTISTIASQDPIFHKYLADRGYVFAQ